MLFSLTLIPFSIVQNYLWYFGHPNRNFGWTHLSYFFSMVTWPTWHLTTPHWKIKKFVGTWFSGSPEILLPDLIILFSSPQIWDVYNLKCLACIFKFKCHTLNEAFKKTLHALIISASITKHCQLCLTELQSKHLVFCKHYKVKSRKVGSSEQHQRLGEYQ